MTSMATSERERRYNIIRRLSLKQTKHMKSLYNKFSQGQSFEYEEAVILNNVLVQALAQAEEDLKTDPDRFIK